MHVCCCCVFNVTGSCVKGILTKLRTSKNNFLIEEGNFIKRNDKNTDARITNLQFAEHPRQECWCSRRQERADVNAFLFQNEIPPGVANSISLFFYKPFSLVVTKSQKIDQ